jgi:hypothetical protein
VSYHHGLLTHRVETGERATGKARELAERLAHKAHVAPECRSNVGLDYRIIRARHSEFGIGWDHQRRYGAQIVALSGSKRAIGGHYSPQSKRLAKRCFI